MGLLPLRRRPCLHREHCCHYLGQRRLLLPGLHVLVEILLLEREGHLDLLHLRLVRRWRNLLGPLLVEKV